MSHTPDEAVVAEVETLLKVFTKEENYKKAAITCSVFLKRRKNLDASLLNSVRRLMLQSYLQLKEYQQVIDWVKNNSEDGQEHLDLGLYAQYRLEQYDQVSKLDTTTATILEQHLLAQSLYHMKQVEPSLKVYQDMLAEEHDNTESRMELLVNSLTVQASDAVPYVALEDLSVLEQSTQFLDEQPAYPDLAFNLGTLQSLTSPSDINWLDHAQAIDEDSADLAAVETNLAWSQHMWYKDVEEVAYSTENGTPAQIAVAKLNQALLGRKPLPTNPHAKWSPLQVRMYWYNRAVQQFLTKNYVECLESCQSLTKTLGESSKKKKGKANESTTPRHLWWATRVDVLSAHAQQKQEKPKEAITRLQHRLEILNAQPTNPTVDHALAHVQLHLHVMQQPQANSAQKQKVLESLPSSIQSKPAVVATFEVLGVNVEEAKSKKSDNPLARAPALFAKGEYESVVELYNSHLSNPAGCTQEELPHHLQHLQALALTGRHKEVKQLRDSLQQHLSVHDTPNSSNGEKLEQQALPRSSTPSTILTASAEDNGAKRSPESVLRQRARRREVYLKSLTEKGLYNPDRPTKPNTERWVPKHERSRARRKGQQNRSAQGGGYASAADTQRLDAAARRAGKVQAGAGPSTATMQVSGGRKNGRRR